MDKSSQPQEPVVTTQPPTVNLRLESSPETLTLVRGMLGGVAELIQLDPELLDDLKTAVSEACNNVVMHAYEGASGPLCICILTEPDGLVVIVRDEGRGIPAIAPSDDRLQGVGIPIMRALAQQTAFRPLPEGGTEVWMQFPGQRDGQVLYQARAEVAAEDGWSAKQTGDAVVSLSPVGMLGGVLGRLARALAARARFSLDRFSDVYLVTDALSEYASNAAITSRVSFCIVTDTRRLEVTLGPFRADAGRGPADEDDDLAAALRLLSDEFEIRSENGT